MRIDSVDINFIDRTNVFVEVTSPNWRAPFKISIQQFIEEIHVAKLQENIDNLSLVVENRKVKVNVKSLNIEAPSVFSEKFIDQNISYNLPPKDASEVTGMHLMIDNDGNYMYIWTGKKWKRVMLAEW